MFADAIRYDIEEIGSCVTNTRPGSQHIVTVDDRFFWSYAQEEALIAVSELHNGCYRLIADPERRARRIAGRYADLYFRSIDKTAGAMRFHWAALAAFVVKDIVEAYRFARDELLSGSFRSSDAAKLGSLFLAGGMPYEHAVRTYLALAKGNLRLFMDVYPWLWFVLEYGVRADGSLHAVRLAQCPDARDWSTLQRQSKEAVDILPFGRRWLLRCSEVLADDVVHREASARFHTSPVLAAQAGNPVAARAAYAHYHVRTQVRRHDIGYRMPPAVYWAKFREAFYVLDAERAELKRLAGDGKALQRLERIKRFQPTAQVRQAYASYLQQATLDDKKEKAIQRRLELKAIASHEQKNVLQPLIYNDAKLKETLDAAHALGRRFGHWLSPHFRVVYSAAPHTDDPRLISRFDEPQGLWDQAKGTDKSQANQKDRIEFVEEIAEKFNGLMEKQEGYMHAQLAQIRKWIDA